MAHFSKILAVLFVSFATGCTALPSDEMSDARDPYETANRSVFEFNMAVDDYVLEPVAKGYRSMPEGAQTALTNFGKWTSYPSTAVNSTLQGKFENAALATIHFLVNGLTFGLVDLTENDDNPTSEDFGQTMATWNVPQGDYIMMPFLGAGTTRSHTGWVVDAFTNPLGFMGEPTVDTIRMASTPTRIVTFRGNNFDQINEVKYNSIDPYAKTRSLFFQYRDGQIVGLSADQPSESDKAFDDFFSDE